MSNLSNFVEEGLSEEKNLVIALNSSKSDKMWSVITLENPEKYFAVRVSTKKYSTIHKKNISCKSDIFIAKGNVPEEEIKRKGFLLQEKDAKEFNLEPQIESGISVKKPEAIIQWQKIGIKGFEKIFGHTELGAGVSLYRQRGINHDSVEYSLEQNSLIVEKWCGGWSSFEKFYSKINGIEVLKDKQVSSDKRCEVAKKVVKFADDEMRRKIDSDNILQQKIFWGKDVFEEPFCASWVYEKGILRSTKGYFPRYTITTGNSRTKNFNIAIKGA